MSPPTYADSRWPNSLKLQVAFSRGFVPGGPPLFFFFLGVMKMLSEKREKSRGQAEDLGPFI